jgi:hypothetical protein
MKPIAFAALAAVLFVSPAQAETSISHARAGSWTYKIFANDLQGIAPWINAECAPKDTSGVKGFVAQERKGGEYKVYVFCRMDRTTTDWTLDTVPGGVPEFAAGLAARFEIGRTALIGFLTQTNSDVIVLLKHD